MSYFTVNANYAFGIDISKYNTSADGKKKVNFDTIAAHNPKVVFTGIRAGISWGYQDPWYSFYCKEAQRIGVGVLPYHVLYPAENATSQMDNFLRIVGEDGLAGSRLVLDLELTHGCSKFTITQMVAECVKLLKARTGRLPVIYSRANWVNLNLSVIDLPVLDWWLAQYRTAKKYPLFTPEYQAPPDLPIGVKTWLIHQTAEKAPSIGADGNWYMDYNRWNGGEAAVLKYFNRDVVVQPPLTLEEKVERMWAVHPEVH